MGALARLLESRAVPKTDKDWRRVLGSFGGLATAAGPKVNEGTALGLSAVYACVRVLAESIGQLPLHVYQREGRSRQRASSHPTYSLLHTLANPEMTAFEMREWMTASLALRGNALFAKEISRGGRPIALWPIPWSEVEVRRGADTNLRFHWAPSNAPPVVFRADEVWYTRGLGFDGVTGASPIAISRESLGVALASQEYAGRFFSNGSQPGGILEHPASLGSPEAVNRLRTQWDEMMTGLTNKHKTVILEEGMKWHQIGLSPKDSQLIEERKFSQLEICAMFRVPPHLIANLDRATFGNIEHQSIEFVMHTLGPYMVRIAQSAQRDLLTAKERESHYVEFLPDALLRGDTVGRFSAYTQGITSGWLTRNEARERENLDPIKGLDEPLVPLNMDGGTRPVGKDGEPTPTPRALVPVFRDAATRMLKIESREVATVLRERKPEEREVGLQKLYAQGGALREKLLAVVTPAIAAREIARGGEGSAELAAALIDAHARESLEMVLARVASAPGSDPRAAVEWLFDEWLTHRVAAIAKCETAAPLRAA